MSKLTTANNSNNPIVRNLTKARESVDSASKKMTNPETSKYENFSQLGALSNTYNNSQTSLARIEQFDQNITTTTTNLKDQEKVIRDCQALISKHKNTKIENNGAKVFTVTQIAEKSLMEAQKLLNATNSNGSYILGGIKSNVAPCGVDLVKTTNIDANDKITSNYTKAVVSPQTVEVSNGHSVTTGDLSADHSAFQKAIAGFNQDKAGKEAEAEKNLKEAQKELEALLAKNLEQQKTLEEAQKRNNSDQEHHTSILSKNFCEDPIVSFTDLKTCQQSYMTEMALLSQMLASENRLFSVLMGH